MTSSAPAVQQCVERGRGIVRVESPLHRSCITLFGLGRVRRHYSKPVDADSLGERYAAW